MIAGTHYTDQVLFSRIAEEDENAFRLLFDRYRLELYGVALKLTKSPVKAEEIIQEVFINLWVSRRRLPAVERPDAYIFRVLYNEISDYLRKDSNRERIMRDAMRFRSAETAEGNFTEEAIDLHQSEKLIEQALQQLPEQQKTVYRLSRQQGLSIVEIASQMGISPNTVKSHLSKALNFIRNYLKDVATVVALLAIFKENSPFQ